MVFNSKSTSWNPVERLIFPAPAASYDLGSFPEELLLIPGGASGVDVPCILLPFKHARFLFIYFHANAEDIGLCYPFLQVLRDLFQVHVLAVEYPGYGLCHGTADEAGILANAAAALRFATEDLEWPLDSIMLFGRSLGTGPCMALAAQHTVAGVVLVSPFKGIQDLFRTQLGAIAGFVGDRFANGERAPAVRSPTMIVHGMRDRLIPLEHGRSVYERLRCRKIMVCPAEMGHNTSLLASPATLVLPMTHFFPLPDYAFDEIRVPQWAFAKRTAGLPRASLLGACCIPEHCPRELAGCSGEDVDNAAVLDRLAAIPNAIATPSCPWTQVPVATAVLPVLVHEPVGSVPVLPPGDVSNAPAAEDGDTKAAATAGGVPASCPRPLGVPHLSLATVDRRPPDVVQSARQPSKRSGVAVGARPWPMSARSAAEGYAVSHWRLSLGRKAEAVGSADRPGISQANGAESHGTLSPDSRSSL